MLYFPMHIFTANHIYTSKANTLLLRLLYFGCSDITREMYSPSYIYIYIYIYMKQYDYNAS